MFVLPWCQGVARGRAGGVRGASVPGWTGRVCPVRAKWTVRDGRAVGAWPRWRGCTDGAADERVDSEDGEGEEGIEAGLPFPESQLLQYLKQAEEMEVGYQRAKAEDTSLRFTDAMDFFRLREGTWSSTRVTHHLAFKRDESGESAIRMHVLDKEDERLLELCAQHDSDPQHLLGGCSVSWNATLQWDQEGDNHQGVAVFALVSEPGSNGRRGKLLRDRGYAEVVPVAGDFELRDDGMLSMVTPYEGGEVNEHFKFETPDVMWRFSTVKRFGGFSNSSFAVERRVPASTAPADDGGGDSSSEAERELNELGIDLNELRLIPTPTMTFKEAEEQRKQTSRFRIPLSARYGRLAQRYASETELDESKLPPSLRHLTSPPPSEPPPSPPPESSGDE